MAKDTAPSPAVALDRGSALGSRSRHLVRGWSSPDTVLLLLIVVNVLLGLTGFNHYGLSIDEPGTARYATDALAAYRLPRSWESYGDLKYYGPAYLVFAESTAQWLVRYIPSWPLVDARHFVYHLGFQLAVVSLYVLCQRFMGKWPALAATLLFATQPLLFGHSFINPKDTPFMAFFLASITSGMMFSLLLQAIGTNSGLVRPDQKSSLRQWLSIALGDWRQSTTRRKVLFVVLLLVAAGVMADLLLFNALVLPFLQDSVVHAYRGTSIGPVNRWFSRVAENAGGIPVELYVIKMTRLYTRMRFLVAAAAFLPCLWVGRSIFASISWRWSLRKWLALRDFADGRLWATLLVSAVVLGLTTSIRPSGLFAGFLVSLAALAKGRLRSVLPLAVYWGIAALVCYGTWPYLWASPLERLVESSRVMANFPWDGDVLYRGRFFESAPREWHYVLFPMLVQFTTPSIALAGLGVAISVRRALTRRAEMAMLILLALWLFAPPAAFIVLKATIYDNSRQLQFVVPSLFVFSGIGLDALLSKVRRVAGKVLVVLALILPGVVGIAVLHPYEYIFYNALVGGVHGAFRSYELDYWCVSSREATDIVNSVAPPGAEIAVVHWVDLVTPFARSDLAVFRIVTEADLEDRDPELAIVCTRSNYDQLYFSGYETVGEVKAGGGVLAVVRDLRTRR